MKYLACDTIFPVQRKGETPPLNFASFTYTNLNLGHKKVIIIAASMINSLICLFSL